MRRDCQADKLAGGLVEPVNDFRVRASAAGAATVGAVHPHLEAAR